MSEPALATDIENNSQNCEKTCTSSTKGSNSREKKKKREAMPLKKTNTILVLGLGYHTGLCTGQYHTGHSTRIRDCSLYQDNQKNQYHIGLSTMIPMVHCTQNKTGKQMPAKKEKNLLLILVLNCRKIKRKRMHME